MLFVDPQRCYTGCCKSAEATGSVKVDCMWLLGKEHRSHGSLGSRVCGWTNNFQ